MFYGGVLGYQFFCEHFLCLMRFYQEGGAGGGGIEFPPPIIELPFPLVKRKYAPIPTAIKIRIIKIQIQTLIPLLFFIILLL